MVFGSRRKSNWWTSGVSDAVCLCLLGGNVPYMEMPGKSLGPIGIFRIFSFPLTPNTRGFVEWMCTFLWTEQTHFHAQSRRNNEEQGLGMIYFSSNNAKNMWIMRKTIMCPISRHPKGPKNARTSKHTISWFFTIFTRRVWPSLRKVIYATKLINFCCIRHSSFTPCTSLILVCIINCSYEYVCHHFMGRHSDVGYITGLLSTKEYSGMSFYMYVIPVRLVQRLMDYFNINDAFWRIEMAFNQAINHRAFVEEEECDWP